MGSGVGDESGWLTWPAVIVLGAMGSGDGVISAVLQPAKQITSSKIEGPLMGFPHCERGANTLQYGKCSRIITERSLSFSTPSILLAGDLGVSSSSSMPWMALLSGIVRRGNEESVCPVVELHIREVAGSSPSAPTFPLTDPISRNESFFLPEVGRNMSRFL